MTNEEAISLLNKITSYCYFVDGYGDMIDSEPYYEAVDLAIKALEQQSCEYKPLIIDKPKDEDMLELLRTFQNQKVLVAEHDCLPSVTLLAEPCDDCISRQAVLEKDWEESADFYAEVLCRKLTKLGKLKVVDNKYMGVKDGDSN